MKMGSKIIEDLLERRREKRKQERANRPVKYDFFEIEEKITLPRGKIKNISLEEYFDITGKSISDYDFKSLIYDVISHRDKDTDISKLLKNGIKKTLPENAETSVEFSVHRETFSGNLFFVYASALALIPKSKEKKQEYDFFIVPPEVNKCSTERYFELHTDKIQSLYREESFSCEIDICYDNEDLPLENKILNKFKCLVPHNIKIVTGYSEGNGSFSGSSFSVKVNATLLVPEKWFFEVDE